ncbi:MAG: tRNA pseudouridine(55) synthase TruB [Hyphomicrobiales bacterium]|nr:tRNA pseudouridine(55) synthase TruB [Hyphomicrobiales bacterium]MCP5370153.1 tRNA pseudouridine(55) synthase TruB [Hyphomicrobiales bacterium]
MGRRRKGRPIHGWLIVDKPAGMSSNAVVGAVRRATGAAKVGHGGTLDPLATGVLPVALGEATKTVAYVMDGTKVYHFTIRWGEARSTDDAEGEVTETSPVRPGAAEVRARLADFIGEIVQVPPAYSAVKVDGQRAYKLARADKPVDLAPRRIVIHDFTLLDMPDADHALFQVVSGKGAYMRALARDLALALGTCGHIAMLRRIAVGPFSQDTAISLDKLVDVGHSARLADFLLPVETALDDIPALALTEAEARRLQHGQPIPVLPVAARSPFKEVGQGDTVCAMSEGKLVALARISGGEIRPLRVLNM